MNPVSAKRISDLKGTLSPCPLNLPSPDYSLFDVKGLDPNVFKLGIYKGEGNEVWTFFFQQREGVWHQCGNFTDNPLNDLFGEQTKSSWRPELNGGFDTPDLWLNNLLNKLNQEA